MHLNTSTFLKTLTVQEHPDVTLSLSRLSALILITSSLAALPYMGRLDRVNKVGERSPSAVLDHQDNSGYRLPCPSRRVRVNIHHLRGRLIPDTLRRRPDDLATCWPHTLLRGDTELHQGHCGGQQKEAYEGEA